MKRQLFFEKHNYMGKSKIIGGQPADPGEYPWQVLFVKKYIDLTTGQTLYENNCGGTLISDQWVITADHCIDNFDWT